MGGGWFRRLYTIAAFAPIATPAPGNAPDGARLPKKVHKKGV